MHRQNSQKSSNSNGFRLIDDHIETSSVYSLYKQKIDQMFDNDSQISNSVQAKIERMFDEVVHEEDIRDSGNHIFSIDYLGSITLKEKVTSLTGLQIPLKELYFTYKKNSKNKQALTGKLEISSAGLKVRYQGQKGDLEQLNPFPTIAVWSAVKFVLNNASNTFAFLPLITDPDNIDKKSLFQNLEEDEFKYILNRNHSPLFTVVMRKIGLQKQLECHGFICQTSEDAIVIAATLYKSLMNYMKNKTNKPKNKNGLSCISVTSSTFENVPIRPPRKKRSTSSISSDTITTDLVKPIKKSPKNHKAPTVPASDTNLQIKKTLEDMDEIKTVVSENDSKELNRSRSLRRRSEDGIITKSGDISGDILTKVTIPRSGSFLNAGGLTRYKSKAIKTNGLTSGGSPLGFSELFTEFRLQENLHSLDDILGAIVRAEGMSFNELKPIYKEFLLKLSVTLTQDELFYRARAIMRRQRRQARVVPSKDKGVKRIGVSRIKRVFRKSFRVNLTRKIKSKKLKSLQLSSIETKSSPPPESSISTSSYDTRHFRPKTSPVNKKQGFKKRHDQKQKHSTRGRRDRMSTSEDSDFFTMKRRKEKNSPNNQNRNSSSGYVSCSECSYDSDSCTCISADKCYCSLGTRLPPSKPPTKPPSKPKPPSKHTLNPPTNKPHYPSHQSHSHTLTTTSSACPECHTGTARCYCDQRGLDLEGVVREGRGCQVKQYKCWKERGGHADSLATLTWCGFETDTCTESEKCYCQHGRSRVLEEIKREKESRKSKKPQKKTNKFDPKSRIFEELQRKGFFPPVEAQKSPTNKSFLHSNVINNNNNNKHNKNYSNYNTLDCQNCNANSSVFQQLTHQAFLHSQCEDLNLIYDRNLTKKNSNTRSTGSVEYVHNPPERYYEQLNMKNRFEDQMRRRTVSENNVGENDINREVYRRAMSEVQTRNLVSSVRSFKSFNGKTGGNTLQKSIPPSSSTEALSVKKSAEIAALFTDLKLSQTTDITHLLGSARRAVVPPYTHRAGPGGTAPAPGMYSASRGLYTIQSQSDASSSDTQGKHGARGGVGGIETSLGYLP